MTPSEDMGVQALCMKHGERLAIVETKIETIQDTVGIVSAKLDRVLERIPEEGVRRNTARIPAPPRQAWYAVVLPYFAPLLKSFGNAIVIVTLGFFLVLLAVKQPGIAQSAIDTLKDFAPQSIAR